MGIKLLFCVHVCIGEKKLLQFISVFLIINSYYNVKFNKYQYERGIKSSSLKIRYFSIYIAPGDRRIHALRENSCNFLTLLTPVISDKIKSSRRLGWKSEAFLNENIHFLYFTFYTTHLYLLTYGNKFYPINWKVQQIRNVTHGNFMNLENGLRIYFYNFSKYRLYQMCNMVK